MEATRTPEIFPVKEDNYKYAADGPDPISQSASSKEKDEVQPLNTSRNSENIHKR